MEASDVTQLLQSKVHKTTAALVLWQGLQVPS